MTVPPQGPAFSPQEIPFSHSGSWFNFSPVIAEKTYADDVHLVSHQNGLHPILRMVPIGQDRHRQHTTVTATPALLTWHHHLGGAVALAYENADTVRVTGTGLDLLLTAANPALTPFSGPYFFRDPIDGAHVYTVYETGRRYRITVVSGRLADVSGGQALGVTERGVVCTGDGEPWEVAIEEYETARTPYRPEFLFDEVHKRAQAAFSAFADAVAPWRDEHTPAAELATYVLWSATVRPAGFLARPGVLMSKHWMDKVWSWDHCFNALALADGQPELAWDQFQTPFDHQEPGGALPDSVTHSEVLYNFVKPPIHGWALRRLRGQIHLEPAELQATYRRLAGWTRFWLTHRRAPGSPLAHYQHGNDSGWDNATCFDPERVIESADLAAFLVLQLRELADLATELGLESDADAWQRSAAQMHNDLIAQLWTGDRFQARGALSGGTWTSTSLLDLMPIILGAELDVAISDALAQRISAHLTPYGLATELPTSPHYAADGYWRGPVWAPSTVLIEDGLRRAGHTNLADDISSRFRALCEKSGFAENFDALTGAGLRDRAYTWTASAYLLLAAAHQQRQHQP